MAGKKTLLSHHIPHHFSSHLDFMNQDFWSVSLLRNTAQNDPTIGQHIVTFFESSKPIHYSLIITAFCMVLLVIVLLTCVCYLKIPQFLAALLCCFSETCCLKKRAILQNQDMHNLNVLYQNEHNEEARVMFVPSCPAQEPASILRNPPNAQPNQVQGNLTLCRNNIPSCYCAHKGPFGPFTECKLEMISK